MDINKYIGNKIRELREKKNLTQEDVADYLHTTSQTISRYEIGERKTNQDVLFKLAEFFKVSINDFFPPLSFNNTQKTTEQEEMELLKNTLQRKGFLDENEEMTKEDFDKLMDFAKANKQFIMKNKQDEKNTL